MDTILILAHGSKDPELNLTLSKIAIELKKRFVGMDVQYCYKDIMGPSLSAAVQDCYRRGDRDILIVPYFLTRGRHLRKDIPEILENLAAELPNLTLTLAPHIGYHPALTDILTNKAKEALKTPVQTFEKQK